MKKPCLRGTQNPSTCADSSKNVFKTKHKKNLFLGVTWHVSCVMFHMSCVMSPVSCVSCQVSVVMCHYHMSPFTYQ